MGLRLDRFLGHIVYVCSPACVLTILDKYSKLCNTLGLYLYIDCGARPVFWSVRESFYDGLLERSKKKTRPVPFARGRVLAFKAFLKERTVSKKRRIGSRYV